MTVLTRWEPLREFSTLQDRMNRLFRDTYGDREEASYHLDVRPTGGRL